MWRNIAVLEAGDLCSPGDWTFDHAVAHTLDAYLQAEGFDGVRSRIIDLLKPPLATREWQTAIGELAGEVIEGDVTGMRVHDIADRHQLAVALSFLEAELESAFPGLVGRPAC